MAHFLHSPLPYVWTGWVKLTWGPEDHDRHDYDLRAGGLLVGHIAHFPRHDNRQWLAYLSEAIEPIGRYTTEAEARSALVEAAVREIQK